MQEKTTDISVVETGPAALELKLTETAIQTIQHNIGMAQKLVVSVLEKDIDYGRTPGTPTDSLWDPGAAKVMAAFNCYSGHQVIYHTEEDNLISWCIEAQLISRQSQQVVATGVGAASTRETKYKYRWVEKPEGFGYDLEQAKKLKTKQSGNRILFRIENPEYGELVNTLFQMAAKRAEVDAVKSLPGVGSALKKLFSGSIKDTRKEPDWAGFWGRVAQIGLSEEQVHKLLRVTSVNQWIAQGKTLDQAIKAISEKLAGAQAAKEASAEAERDVEELWPEDAPHAEAARATAVAKPLPTEPEEQPKSDFDKDWLLDALKRVHWSEVTVMSWCKNVYKVDSKGEPLDMKLKLIDFVASLKREDREAFFKEIQDRLDML